MSVLVYVESRQGKLKKAGLESLSVGRTIANEHDRELVALLAGTGLDDTLEEVRKCGPDKVCLVSDEVLADYQPDGCLAAVMKAVEEYSPEVLLMAATSLGRDLAPRIAAKMNIMLLPDITEINAADTITVTRPVYAGKVLMDIRAKELPVVLTTRPNVFDVKEADGKGERIELQVDYRLKAKVVEVVAAEGGKLDVAEADRIVAGGRGMKEAANFALLEELAEVLGAAVGASRAVVDADWRPHAEQVGQTGKVVSPSLYIAAGISGAIQHLAGMKTSKVIVAINKDPEAPIFKVADYGIVGDAMEVVPELTKALKG